MTNDDRVRAAVEEVARKHGKDSTGLEAYPLDEIPGAVYVFERARGGIAAIVADGETLVAASGISKDRHVQAFRDGLRDNHPASG